MKDQENSVFATLVGHLLVQAYTTPSFISTIILRRNIGINVYQYIGDETDDKAPSILRRWIVMPLSSGLFSWLFFKAILSEGAMYIAFLVVLVAYIHLLKWEFSDKNSVVPSHYLGFGHYAQFILKGESSLKKLEDFSNTIELILFGILTVIFYFVDGWMCFIQLLVFCSLTIRVFRNRERRINTQLKITNHRSTDDERRTKKEAKKEEDNCAEASFL